MGKIVVELKEKLPLTGQNSPIELEVPEEMASTISAWRELAISKNGNPGKEAQYNDVTQQIFTWVRSELIKRDKQFKVLLDQAESNGEFFSSFAKRVLLKPSKDDRALDSKEVMPD